MKTDLFSPVATAEFSKFAGKLSAALSQHHLSGFEIAQGLRNCYEGTIQYIIQEINLDGSALAFMVGSH